MFGSLGAPELLIILAIIILIFGVGKISGLGRELGSSIKEFRRAVKDEDKQKEEEAAQAQEAYQAQVEPAPPAPPVQQAAPPPAAQQQAPPPAPPAEPAGSQQGQSKNIF